ncbi:hypothetical protein V8J88_14255 [Massilia sp. W12]|uniref:hypothetical protein n=1 Tax=Massilia sp. W12 TaxID=3126507 RepID=UPI0030D1BADA
MSTHPLDDYDHAQISAWLRQALHGKAALPRVLPDEAAHLALMRLELTLQAHTRRSLQQACKDLLREFCHSAQGDSLYLHELLGLVDQYKDHEQIHLLLGLVARFPDLPCLPLPIKNAVLSVLSMHTTPQPLTFWRDVLQQDPYFAARAISGALASDKMQALDLLPLMPDDAEEGGATKLKLNRAWKTMEFEQRERFVQAIQAILPSCRAKFATPIAAWLETKQPIPAPPSNARRDVCHNPTLLSALQTYLSGEQFNQQRLSIGAPRLSA